MLSTVKLILPSTAVIILYQEVNLTGRREIITLLIMRWVKLYYMKHKKVSAVRKAPGFWDHDYDGNALYQAERIIFEETKEKLE